ncbi:MAG: leucine-rich repeat domain-containing protein [Oscillatoriaceae cyanobacterium Prado104]|jgi:internalin A|nr:leucine-rich repeat domain-containing protein [Oscillatoriaceae cyanobacterium Prado104]
MLKKLSSKRHWHGIVKQYVLRCMLFSLSLILLLEVGRLPEAVGQPTPTANYQTFTDWCANKANLNYQARLTVDLLLEQAGSKDCKQADRKLSSLTELKINDKPISNLHPLKSLVNLTSLNIWRSQISDLTPLESLTQLTYLDLFSNKISNLTPLKSLTNLTYLCLNFNQISDVTPLKFLTKLTYLDLSFNYISDVTPIKSLINLTSLHLIANQISDLTPLKSLIKLTDIYLTGNRSIARKICPVLPESICKF